ncbi:helix-turn-helix domain-containing protein [Caulobacter mirabilis]|uniref:Transcriptional regulator n=1 Tax=Caulobacter mirabilis TaxID=69666 RepID=A0A2D2AU54_9CAUL|nr:helix-turn-helix transcriptional regulator [Caulobacter mirabilis]ATQ41495.1 transcriptional regulator [Caulobacter mirabilis]
MARTATGLSGPHPVDRHVGLAIRVRRRGLGLTQTALAGRLGITFQQVQKYERGKNRVSASMLHAMAEALETSVGAFFEGLPRGAAAVAGAAGRGRVAEMLAAPGGTELADAWLALPSDRMRRRLSALVRAMAPYAAAPARRDPAGSGGGPG